MKICYKCNKSIKPNNSFHGLHEDCFHQWFDHTSLMDFTDLSLKRSDDSSSFASPSLHTSFFQGKFKKYSARLADKSYLIKVEQSGFEELPHIEYISNLIAKELGLHIPPFYFIRFMNEMNAFVVHNFMENYRPGNLIHIYHFLNSGEFSLSNVLAIISEKVGRIDAIHQFIHLCLYDALIGNHDRHGRNIALIETTKGFVLSPFYDNPSYIGIESQGLLLAEHNPKGKLATSLTFEPTLKDYAQECIEMGYSEITYDFYNRVKQVDFNNIVKKSYLSEKRQQAFLNIIMRRLEELENVV